MHKSASCYWYKKNWMEQPLSHVSQVELDSGNQDLSWRFSSPHGLSVENSFPLTRTNQGSKFVQGLYDDVDTGGPFQSKEKLPPLNCKSYPSLAFRRHSKFPESISRFTDLLRSIKTHHINQVLTPTPQEHPRFKNKINPLYPSHVYRNLNPEQHLPTATCS